MKLSISPAKMVVARVVSHRSLEREVLRALEDFGHFQFIDVPRQAGIVKVELTREENTVISAMGRVTRLLDLLRLEPSVRSGSPLRVEEGSIKDILDFVAGVIKAIEAEVLEIDRNITAARQQLERERGVHDVAERLVPLGLSPQRIGTTEFTFTTAGILPTERVSQLEWSLKELTDNAFAFRSIALERGVSVAAASVPVEHKPAVLRVLSAMEFEEFEVPEGYGVSPEEIARSAAARMSELQTQLESLEARRRLLAEEWGPRVLAAWEALDIESRRIDAKRFIVYTEQSMKVWGWIPAGMEDRLSESVRRWTGSVCDIAFEEPDFAEVEAPTYLDNPSVMRPTENVVNAFGTPSLHDIDPTKIMFFSFPLIFGLVFADVGQGFLVLLVGLLAWRARRRGDDWGGILGYLQAGAEGLVTLGLFSMLGGFLFGSFFGAETVIEPMWPVFAHTLENGEPNPWRSIHMLKLSVEIGIIQISLGIFLDLYNKLRHHDYRGAVAAASYLWLYLGFVNLLFGVGYRSISDWFSMSRTVNLWLPIVGIGYGAGDNGVYPPLPISAFAFAVVALIVPLIVMMVSSFMGGIDGSVHFMENALAIISHTVSYARIFALNAVHVILSAVFITNLTPLIDIPFPPVTLFGVEIIPEHIVEHGHVVSPHLPFSGAFLGTLTVGTLEGLLAFMHTLRLHFVEWFSKFYHAGGKPFRPFTVRRVHTVPPAPPPLTETVAVTSPQHVAPVAPTA